MGIRDNIRNAWERRQQETAGESNKPNVIDDTSDPGQNEEDDDDRLRCCPGHFTAENRAQRRLADRYCTHGRKAKREWPLKPAS